MPLISDTIPNLTGGVSQQANNLRYSNTAEACENAMLSPVTGMQKRQAAEWLGEMHPYGTTSDLVLDDKTAVHWIDRDATEHYALTVDSNGLRAYDADTGQALNVIVPSEVTTYLTSDGEGGTASDYQDSLRFVTVADTTFIANRNVTVQGSVDSDFQPHHFAAFPQLAYDTDRGGSGILDGSTVNRIRSDAGYSQTTFQYNNPSWPANTTRYAVMSASGSANNGVHIRARNTNNYSYPSDFFTAMVSDAQSMRGGATYIICESGKLAHLDYSLYQDVVRGLQMTSNAESWESYSVAALLTSRHVATRKGSDLLVEYTGAGSDTPVRFSFATVQSQTYGPNGNKTTLFGRTISHDLKIDNGRIKISDDNGTTYRDLRVNDHPTAKLYSTAALRPWAGNDADDTADIDFANVDTSATNYVDTTTTATWPGGSYSSGQQVLFSSAFMPNAAAELALLNDVIWVLGHAHANDNSTSSVPEFVTNTFAPSSVAPVDANGLSYSTVQTGALTNQVATFQDLPGLNGTPAINGGSVYEVGGTAQGDGAYYVIVYDEGSADQKYIETYKTPFILNEATLPIKVQREFDQDGNPQFVASLHQYAPRVVGDENTNVLPSFVDNTINEVFVHSGRLGFLSGESAILSGTDFGGTSNFFRSTVTQLLDDDRIDLNASTGDVAKLIYAAPFANTLLLFSERAQYRLVSSGALTPATSLIQQTGAHATSLLARPQRVGKSVFAAVNDVERTTVREFRADIDTDILESNEVTTQVPKFIPSDVHKLAYSAKKNILVALSHTNTNCLYVYNYYDATNQRLQSAWSKWVLEDDTRIVNVEVLEDYLHLICAVRVPDYVKTLELDNSTGTDFGAYQERTHMVRIPLNEITEVDAKSFPVLADFRVTRAQCINVEGDRQDSADGVGQANQNAFTYSTSSLSSTNLLAIPLPDGLDFSIVELPYKTTATDIRTIFTDPDAYGINPPLLAALNIEIDSASSQAALAAATGTFLASPTQANADAINAIVVNTDNTKVIVIGRLDGVFVTPEDRVLNNITTAVTPNFVMGRAYTLTYEQSPIFYKAGESNVGKTDARLQLRYCTVTCDDTSSFDVEVTADGRQMRKYDYEAFKPGVADFTLGTRRFASESFRFPVFAQNQKCKIVFKNSTVLPSTLTSLEWQGFVSPKAVSVR